VKDTDDLYLLFSFISAEAQDFRKDADRVVENLTSGDFAAVHEAFTVEAKGELAAEQLESIWKRLEEQCGEFSSYAFDIVEEKEGSVNRQDLITFDLWYRFISNNAQTAVCPS